MSVNREITNVYCAIYTKQSRYLINFSQFLRFYTKNSLRTIDKLVNLRYNRAIVRHMIKCLRGFSFLVVSFLLFYTLYIIWFESVNLSRSIFLSFLFTLRIYFCAILKQNSKSIVCPIRKKAVFNAYLLCFTERKQIFIIKCSESRLTFNPAVLQTVAKKYCYRRQNPERRIGFMNIREFLLTFNPAVLLTVAKKYRYRRRNLERRIGAAWIFCEKYGICIQNMVYYNSVYKATPHN